MGSLAGTNPMNGQRVVLQRKLAAPAWVAVVATVMDVAVSWWALSAGYSERNPVAGAAMTASGVVAVLLAGVAVRLGLVAGFVGLGRLSVPRQAPGIALVALWGVAAWWGFVAVRNVLVVT